MKATGNLFWTPLYLILVYLIIKQERWNTLYMLLGMGLTITLTDQLTSTLMKPFFGLLRPSHDPSLKGIIHLVDNYKGGLYRFPSSHAANSFGGAMFIYLLLVKHIPSIWTLFIWVFLFSYTRIYLGVHYPSDLLVGWVVGGSCGYLVFFGINRIKIFLKKRLI